MSNDDIQKLECWIEASNLSKLILEYIGENVGGRHVSLGDGIYKEK